MPLTDPYGFEKDASVLLEAEVASSGVSRFASRYQRAADVLVSPGKPRELQVQNNKWGAECRIYFNSDAVRDWAVSVGLHVEAGRPYQPSYQYRINNNDLWWELVEVYKYRLGVN